MISLLQILNQSLRGTRQWVSGLSQAHRGSG